MTKDEIFKRIKEYESKWGKLGESNSILHSSIQNKNTQRKDKKTMLRTDNDFYAYRQKVLAGKEQNKLAHASTIDINELNKRYYQELLDKNVIIHTAPDDDVVPQGYIRISRRPKQEEEVTYGRENMYERMKESEITRASLSHSAEEYEGVMDEYHDFMEKVKKGREANRLAHSSYISPDELNRKYYEQLAEKAFLVHSGSNNQQYGSYYHKIDDYYGKGKHRYFETKEEYDAYVENKNKETAKTKEAERGNDMSGYEDWKKNEESVDRLRKTLKDVKTKKEEAQKDTARKQGGMEGYEDWKKNKDREDMYKGLSEKARQHNEELAKKEKNQKDTARQQGGMEGYESWKKNKDEYEAGEKRENEKAQSFGKNKMAATVKKISTALDNGDTKSAIKEIKDSDEYKNLKDIQDKVISNLTKKGYDVNNLRNSQAKKEEPGLMKEYDNISKQLTQIVKDSCKNRKDGRDTYDEIIKELTKDNLNNYTGSISKTRSGMEGYEDWKSNKDKSDKQKDEAKRRGGMEGYDEWDKKRKAEAAAKKKSNEEAVRKNTEAGKAQEAEEEEMAKNSKNEKRKRDAESTINKRDKEIKENTKRTQKSIDDENINLKNMVDDIEKKVLKAQDNYRSSEGDDAIKAYDKAIDDAIKQLEDYLDEGGHSNTNTKEALAVLNKLEKMQNNSNAKSSISSAGALSNLLGYKKTN